jgi:hypothetical protein
VPGALQTLDFPEAVESQEYRRLHDDSYAKVAEVTVPTILYNGGIYN